MNELELSARASALRPVARFLCLSSALALTIACGALACTSDADDAADGDTGAGGAASGWVTLVMVKKKGGWKIVHDHTS